MKSKANPKALAIAKQFAHNIRAIQKAKGLTAVEVSRRAKMDRSHMYEMFRGDANITMETIERYASAVDCNVEITLIPKEIILP